MSRIGEEKSHNTRVLWVLVIILITVSAAVFYWAMTEWLDANSFKAQVALVTVFSMGVYNIIGFILGLPILTIGGTGVDYGDRLVGVFFGLVFIVSSIIVLVRF